MSSVKQQAMEVIAALPDDCTFEDIQYHLYVREKVERGIRDVENGRVVSQAEAEKRIKGWQASTGPSQR
jgi:predicted transcriptional regulator